MSQSKYVFQWFEKEDRRRRLCASLGRDGKLRLGDPLRQKLPEHIQIGFDIGRRTLAIADGHGSGWPRGGVLTAETLSAQVVASGLKLPLSFELALDEASGYWLGHAVPKRHLCGGRRRYDANELLTLYGYIVDNAVRQLAKTTPPSERRAIAIEAFCVAADAYRKGYGPLEGYLAAEVETSLRRENKQYTAVYAHRSLEKPLRADQEDGFCLHDVLSDSSSGGIDAMEERIMAEQFQEILTAQERKLLRLMSAECSVAQMAEELDMEENALMDLGQEIGLQTQAVLRCGINKRGDAAMPASFIA